MKYLAMLKDSLLETIDFKVFYVMLGLSVVLTLACASFTFHRQPIEEVLEKNLGHAFRVGEVQELERSYVTPYARYRVTFQPKAAEPGKVLDELREGVQKNFRARDRQLQRIRQQLQIEERRGEFSPEEGFKSPPPPDRPLAKTWEGLSEQYFLSPAGIGAVDFQGSSPGSTPSTEPITVEMEVNWAELWHSHQIGFLFGAWKLDLREQAMGEAVVSWIQSPLVGWIAGWIGIIIAVVVTAGFVPNMLRKGTVDFLLVKPISRPTLLIYKYGGGLSFVFLNSVVLIAASWVAFGFTTSNWSPWYLASILVLTFYFAILYSFSVLVGVLTRSALASILLTIGFWFVLFVVNQIFTLVHFPVFEQKIKEEAAWIFPIVDTIHMILPKPGTLDILNSSLLLQAYGSEEVLKLQQIALSKFSWSETLSTSGAFIAIMLGLASWRFARRDY